MKPDVTNAISKSANAASLTHDVSNNITSTGGLENKPSLKDNIEDITNTLPEKEEYNEISEDMEKSPTSNNGYGAKRPPGAYSRVGNGKQLNENNQVEDSSTKKNLKGAGRLAAAYFTGGESIGMDKDIAGSGPVDDALGKIADKVDDIPGAKQLNDELDEAGISDGVNDALDVVSSVKNKDIGGTLKSANKLKKDAGKSAKYALKKALIAIGIGFFVVFIVVIIIAAIAGPIAGGIMDVVEKFNNVKVTVSDKINDFMGIYQEPDPEEVSKYLSEVPDYEGLSEIRQGILKAAAEAVSAGIPYLWGGKADGPGIDGIMQGDAALDCSGFVTWAIWTATGQNPGNLNVEGITNSSKFVEIPKEEVQPGDIGVRLGATGNHTGIYAGNNQWYHAPGKGKYVTRTNYNSFKKYYRYVG